MLYKAKIAEKLYIRKRSREEYRAKVLRSSKSGGNTPGGEPPEPLEELDLNSPKNLKHMFSRFKFSTFNLVFDPFIYRLCWPLERCKVFKSFDRIKLLDKVNTKFTKELDLV